MTESAINHEKLNKFMEEVLAKLLPNARWKSVGAFGAASTKMFNYARLSLSDSREVYSESIFDYNGSYRFIHYTNLKALISIIRDKSLRMYEIMSMDDLQEFEFASSHIGLNSNFHNRKMKKKIFCLSMCKYELERKEQSLDQWRQYGGDGTGCGIVLRFRKSNNNKWIHYLLSEMHYGSKKLDVLKTYVQDYTDFSQQNHFTIQNFQELIYPLLCFYKQDFYKSEQEVRLLFNNGMDYRTQQHRKTRVDLNARGEKVRFTELELENERWKKLEGSTEDDLKILKVIYPYVAIDEIIFGYRVSKNVKYDCMDAVREIYKEVGYKGAPKFSVSPLTGYFK